MPTPAGLDLTPLLAVSIGVIVALGVALFVGQPVVS